MVETKEKFLDFISRKEGMKKYSHIFETRMEKSEKREREKEIERERETETERERERERKNWERV